MDNSIQDLRTISVIRAWLYTAIFLTTCNAIPTSADIPNMQTVVGRNYTFGNYTFARQCSASDLKCKFI